MTAGAAIESRESDAADGHYRHGHRARDHLFLGQRHKKRLRHQTTTPAYGAAILKGATIRPGSLHTLHSLQTVCVSQTRFAKKR